ncbi:FAD dependent oxidoreductase [Dipodascopsis uninucleata]
MVNCLTPLSTTVSTWLSEPSMFSLYRSTEALPSQVDVAIIGGGLSGVSVAFHLLRTYPRLKIVLLEAGEVCAGATGRNGGHLRPDLFSYTETVKKESGIEEAVRISKFERANYEALLSTIRELKIECETTEIGENWSVFFAEDEFREYLRNLSTMRAAGGDVHDVKVYQKEETARITGIPGCVGAIASPATTISGTKLATGLLRECLMQGLNLQTYTKVLSVEWNSAASTPFASASSDSDSDDGFETIDAEGLRVEPEKSAYIHRIMTNRGTILARKVVHATNAYLDTLAPLPTKGLVTPVRAHVMEVANGTGRKLSLDPSINITNMTFNYGKEYVIQRPNGNFVLGGGRRYGNNFGIESVEQAASAENTRRDEIDHNVDLFLRSFLTQTMGYDFGRYIAPKRDGTKEAVAEIHNSSAYSSNYRMIHQWTGIMGFSRDSRPLVGKLPPSHLDDKRSEYCIAGFTGHGMPVIFLSAKYLASMILQDCEDYLYDSQCLELRSLDVDDEHFPATFLIKDERLATLS